MKKTLVICLAFALSAPVYAVQVPTPSPDDTRVKTVVYNPRDVVRINGMVGIATHIQLEPGERYIEHVFGDSEGWHFADNGNHIFLKPKAENADSNLVLITDRRVYYFELHYSDAKKARDKVFGLTFVYPQTKAAETAQAIERKRVAEAFQTPRPINTGYTMTGKRELAPVNVWDNKQFTFFRFAGAVDIPSIFMVNPDGSESIVNHHVQGTANDTVVVHKVAKQWVLRLGPAALSVFNEAYDPVGVSNTSRTASPEVIRDVVGGNQE
ncbi:MAG: P-type conjugative transfer protein VirB9 [Xanthomonas perforans]|nr:P-type conjugative transfer protein VirB9 [Xanthomonas perforans]